MRFPGSKNSEKTSVAVENKSKNETKTQERKETEKEKFTAIPRREKARSDAPSLLKFTPRTPRIDPNTSKITPSRPGGRKISQEEQSISRELDFLSINLHREEEENLELLESSKAVTPPKKGEMCFPVLPRIISSTIESNKKFAGTTPRTRGNQAPPTFQTEDEASEPFDADSSPRIKIISSPLPDIADPDIEISSKVTIDQVYPSETLSGETDEIVEHFEESREKPTLVEAEKFQPEIQKPMKQYKDRENKNTRLARRTMLRSVQPKNSSELATAVYWSICNDFSSELNIVRALKALYCAAGGNIAVSPDEPGTRFYVEALSNLPDADRWEYLKALLDKLFIYLSVRERKMVGSLLANIYSDQNISKNMECVAVHLATLRVFIENEIRDIKEMKENKKKGTEGLPGASEKPAKSEASDEEPPANT
jgi:hypothetical protein